MMSLEVILLLCAFTVHGTTSQPALETNASNVGIIGGHKESIEDAPFMASLKIWRNAQTVKYFRCGASIIHKQFVMTSGSCCEGAQKIEISVGRHIYMKGKIYEGIYFNTPKKFNMKSLDYDICIIQLNDTLEFGPKIGKITLADNSLHLSNETNLNALGWGATQPHGYPSMYLREVSLPLVSETKCRKTYKYLTTNMICAGAEEKDTCGGDGGGPLTLMNSIQVGITSHGKGDCGSVGVYTKVAAMRNWINTIINTRNEKLN